MLFRSAGPDASDAVQVRDLFLECCNGIPILAAMDKIQGGLVPWKKIKLEPRNRHHLVENGNHVVAVGNSFTIRKLDLNDSENNLFSPGVTELAKDMGWWRPEDEPTTGLFDFFGAYGYQPPAAGGMPYEPKNTIDILKYYSGRRMWRVFSLLSPAEGAKLDPDRGNVPKTKDPYPPSVPAPKGSVTLKMVMDAHRDHYEGTPYDLTKGMAAGPFGNPNREIGRAHV